MKRILGIAALASVLASSAFAADLPVKAPRMVDPVWTWTGFYVGVNGGYSWGRSSTTITPFASIFPTLGYAPFKQNVDGGIAGGQAGYNWQVDPRWLVGVEGDLQWSGERSSRGLSIASARYTSNGVGLPTVTTDFNSIATLSSTLGYDLRWFATFRGRVGLLATPQTLLYATGGLAVGEFRYSAATNLNITVFGPGAAGLIPTGFQLNFPVGPATSSSDTRLGWTAGAGVEHKFTKNWSGKLEYLYVDYGSKTYFAGTANQADVSFKDHVFRAGINYEFIAGPVMAKY
jgi:outer membrane immunogenic protein